MGRPVIAFKSCEVCSVTSDANPETVWFTSKMCRQCHTKKRKLERSPAKRRVRVAKPSVCKHCQRTPSESLKFKSTFLCVECQYKRFTPEELEAYQEHWRTYNKLYNQERSRAHKMYKQGRLKPVETSVSSSSEQSSASSVGVGET